ncbi:hypothetical protein, partial [Pontibacter akesuensis]|uniref:hypothetical protein n=1 Tax=Pontibacter akesuensis TaxID=388950 RepID=UPI001E408EBE
MRHISIGGKGLKVEGLNLHFLSQTSQFCVGFHWLYFYLFSGCGGANKLILQYAPGCLQMHFQHLYLLSFCRCALSANSSFQGFSAALATKAFLEEKANPTLSFLQLTVYEKVFITDGGAAKYNCGGHPDCTAAVQL